MTQQHIPFPSIKQFRNVVDHVRRQAQFKGLDEAGEPIMDRSAKAPTLAFEGMVKLHGTNAAIVFTKDAVQFQSRGRVLTIEQDNAGFMFHMSTKRDELAVVRQEIIDYYGLSNDSTIAVYGEWCGGNIQKNVAIAGLEKMFVIFALRVGAHWVDASCIYGHPEARIFNLTAFPKYSVMIDFNSPELVQNRLAEITQSVEDECPVGKAFGQQGIGEGVVWRCVSDPSSEFWFKVKGEKHSVSKVKTLAAVDVEAITQLKEFADSVVTEARLEQGLQNLTNEQLMPFEMTSIGDFIRWVHNDIVKEESDTMVANGIEPKKIGGLVANIAKRWFIQRLDEKAMD